MSINRRMNKQVIDYSYNGMLLSNKEEWITDTHKNMVNLKNIVQQKKTHRKVHILWFHLDKVLK